MPGMIIVYTRHTVLVVSDVLNGGSHVISALPLYLDNCAPEERDTE